MGRGNRRRGKELEHEVAIRDGIDRVRHGRIEAERRGGGAIDRKARAGERRRPERAFVEPRVRRRNGPGPPNISTYAIR